MKIPHVYIEDMIEAIDKIRTYLQNTTEEQFSHLTVLLKKIPPPPEPGAQ